MMVDDRRQYLIPALTPDFFTPAFGNNPHDCRLISDLAKLQQLLFDWVVSGCRVPGSPVRRTLVFGAGDHRRSIRPAHVDIIVTWAWDFNLTRDSVGRLNGAMRF